MELFSDSKKMKIEEAERAPNRYTAKALGWTLLALFLACLFNDLGIFDTDRTMMWISFVSCGVSSLVAWRLAFTEKYAVNPRTKYVLLSLALLLTLSVATFFNISAVMLLLLPMLLATQYRSMKVTAMAVASSCVCCVLAPVLAWLSNAWSLNILSGYLETACEVSIGEIESVVPDFWESVFKLVVYHSLPQLLVILVFGSILLGVTRNNIRGLANRMQVMNLKDDLARELDHVVYMQDHILYAMADIVENRDSNTGGHVKRTSEVVRALVEAMKSAPDCQLSDSFCEAVVKAAPLHDLGKISIDDVILRKPGPLNEEEREQINEHPVKGAEMVRSILSGMENEEFIRIAVNLALYHHERYDGAGYPEHLKGEEIPLEARIMAIADVYDALVSTRSYKEPVSPQRAFQIIEEMMGTQFDPGLEPYFAAVRTRIEDLYRE